MFQHTKGVLIAAGIAVAVMFLLSLLMSSQLVLQKEIVINKDSKEVFAYLKNAQQFGDWMSDLKGVSLHEKSNDEYVFQGKDNELYRLELNVAEKANGLEVSYFKNDDKKAVFVIQAKAYGEQSIVTIVQYWNLGYNPFTKLLAYKTREKSEAHLEDDLIVLKKQLENQ